VAQALRRVRRFETRTGLRVSRVMAPPHGVCSTAAMHALARLGFDALCISDAYKGANRPLLAGWEPGELLPGGVPLVPRYHLGQPRADLVFRGLLNQPVVLYGHHEDLAGGLEPLHRAADELRELGDVAWMSMEQIAATQFVSRQEGSSLHVRAYARRLSVRVPEGVERLHVELAGTSERFETACAPGTFARVEIPVGSPLQADSVAAPRRSLRPLVRRLATEGRDRLRPVLRS
jgi:hypothetical protein